MYSFLMRRIALRLLTAILAGEKIHAMIFSVELHFEGSSCYLYVFNGDVDPPSQWILGRKKAGSLSEICGGWRL